MGILASMRSGIAYRAPTATAATLIEITRLQITYLEAKDFPKMKYDTESELEEMEAAHDLEDDDYGAMMEAIDCCAHCGNPFEEFWNLGCEYCDARAR